MEQTLSGKVAVVTGASSGIGEATARELAARGASVVLASRALDRLEGLRREIYASGGAALVVETDVSERNSIEAMVWRVVERYAQLAGTRPAVAAATAYAMLDGLFERALLGHLTGQPRSLDDLRTNAVVALRLFA